MKKLLLFTAMLTVWLFSNAQNPVSVYYAQSSRPSQGGEDIYKMLDGNVNTLYHSRYNINAIPDTVDFYFYNVKSINEIKYTPRPSGPNGIWKQVEVYHTTVDAPNNFIKDYDFNWAENSSVKTVTYPGNGIVKPFIVRFIVKSAGGNNYSSCAEMNFLSAETGVLNPSMACDMTGVNLSAYKDVKVTPNTGTANTYNSASESIEKSFDGAYNTMYHSKYNFVVSSSTPAILTYNFTGNPSIDYITYYPRQDGNVNGRFGAIEVLYKLQGQSSFTSLMTTSLEFNSAPSNINLPSKLNNVASIQIKVKTGNNNFASCAEMEFYSKTNFDASLTGGIFDDNLYTKLKTGTTQTQIDAISNDFFKAMANCMFNNTYDNRYRVQTYESYLPPSYLSSLLKTGTYNSYENPTGIYFSAGTDAVLFVGPEADSYNISLKVSDMRVNAAYTSSTYKLKSGINIIPIATEGTSYIDYYTNDTSAPPIKIHIANGKVNGVYDSQIDDDQQWMKLANNPAFETIDLKGKYVNILFETARLKKYNPFEIKSLVNLYDSIVKVQFNIMGLKKYNIIPKNHMFTLANAGGGYYAGGLGAHFDYTWGEDFLSAKAMKSGSMWGIAHEFGHVNQVRPSFKWVGMTEVTNNIYSTYTQFTMGDGHYKNGRLENENILPYEGDNTLSYPSVVGGRIKGYFNRAFVMKQSYQYQNVFAKAAIFWQLQLYYAFAGAMRNAPTLEQRMSDAVAAPVSGPDYAYWIGDVMQKHRARNTSGMSNGQLAMNFVKDVCDATGEDLTDYFTKVGFFVPIDIAIDDYGVSQYTVTQAMADQTIADIKAKGHPAPVSPVLHYITANSLNAFTNKLLAQGTYEQGLTINQDNIVINHAVWQNVVAFETYDINNVLLEPFMPGMRDASNNSTYIDFPANAERIYAVSYDGSKKLVYSRTPLPVTLTNFDAELGPKGAQLKWNTASEQNNKKFEIWKSDDGKNFIKLAEVAGNGTKTSSSNYSYLDANFRTSSYYKLVQVDFDGRSISYDNQIRFVKSLNTEKSLNVYPNPIKNILHINRLGSEAKVEVIDLLGNTVFRGVVTPDGGTLNLSQLTTGVYHLQLTGLFGKVTKRIVKQ